MIESRIQDDTTVYKMAEFDKEEEWARGGVRFFILFFDGVALNCKQFDLSRKKILV